MDATQARTVVVTGASSGIGLGLTRALLAQGHRVVATSRSINTEGLARAGVAASERLQLVAGDVAQRSTAERVVDTAIRSFGALDALVHNAGIFISRPFTEYSADEVAALMGTNVHGFLHLTQLALPHLLRHGEGCVVTVTASISEHPHADIPAAVPVLTKAGLAAATRALALEFATRGVRFNAVSPGVILTPLNADAPRDLLASLQPTGKPGRVEDVVDAILFLLRAPFVTGEVLHVDGGMTTGRW